MFEVLLQSRMKSTLTCVELPSMWKKERLAGVLLMPCVYGHRILTKLKDHGNRHPDGVRKGAGPKNNEYIKRKSKSRHLRDSIQNSKQEKSRKWVRERSNKSEQQKTGSTAKKVKQLGKTVQTIDVTNIAIILEKNSGSHKEDM